MNSYYGRRHKWYGSEKHFFSLKIRALETISENSNPGVLQNQTQESQSCMLFAVVSRVYFSDAGESEAKGSLVS